MLHTFNKIFYHTLNEEEMKCKNFWLWNSCAGSIRVCHDLWRGVGKQRKVIIISSVNGWAGMNRWGIPEVDQLLEQLGSSASQDAPECCSAPRRH